MIVYTSFIRNNSDTALVILHKKYFAKIFGRR